MGISNCLLFYLALRCRRARKGKRGYFAMRQSHWGRFPHILYEFQSPSGKLRMVSFVPVSPSKRLLPPPLFKGRVKWGDTLNPHAGGSVDDRTKP
jgi:hypothetical protein